MNLRTGLILTSLAAMILTLGCSSASERDEAAPVSSPVEKEIRVLVLEGTPYQRGLTHGMTLKKEIHEVVALWKADLAKQAGTDADAFIEKFLKETDFIPAIEKWTPGLLEEVRGIADGAGVEFETMYAFQCMDEIWLYMDGLQAEACSAIALARDEARPVLLAQNMDLEPFRNGYQVVFRIRHTESELEVLALSCAGLIVTTGMNSAPLGVCVNAMSQMDYAKVGLPIAFVVRGLLEQQRLEDAVRFIDTIQHASGQNYILGDSERVVDLEVSANKVIPYVPAQNPGVILHTNHPKINSDYNPGYRQEIERGKTPRELHENTLVRLEALERRLVAKASLDIDDIKSTLSSQDSDEHPVCRVYDTNKSSFTFGTVVHVLSEHPEFHLAPGPPNATPFQIFPVSKNKTVATD